MISKLSKTLLLASLLIFGVGNIKAQDSWLWNFDGTLGKEKIGFTLVSNQIDKFQRGDNLKCNYFYVKYLKDINLRCNIQKDGSFSFEEFDEQGNVTANFRGKFLKNEVDNLEGTWTKTGASSSLPVKLKVSSGTSGNLSKRYEMIGVKDEAKFENQVQEFRNAVLQNDKQKVSSLIQFPIKVKVNEKTVNIKNQKSFLQNYDNIFRKDYIEAIRQTVPHNMFAKDTGAMLGSGIIWFSPDGKVIALNN